MKKALQFIFLILFLASIGFLIVWLWHRQPKASEPEKQSSSTSKNEQVQKVAEIVKPVTTPTDGDIIATNPLKINGKTTSSNRVLIFSNDFEDIAKINPDGTYAVEENLKEGLNQITIVFINGDFKEVDKQNLAVYLVPKSTKLNGDKMVAGNVSKIFENLITVSTFVTDTTIKLTDTTKITIPSSAPSKSPTPKQKGPDIRVGDYIVALGTKLSDNQVAASQLNIFRDNKPQIDKTYSVVKFASPAKLKIFSGSQTKDNKLLEFKLDNNSQIFDNDKKADDRAIAKDRRAIVFYSSKENTASLIYIIP